ncbi:MAG: hypothetical protein AAGA84_10450 [Pseudomonadota bacterium]
MDKTYIEQNNVIERYALDKLTGDELEQFELYLLDHPELLTDIALSEAIAEALPQDLLANPSAPTTSANHAGWRSFSLAASVLIVALSAVSLNLYQDNASLRDSADRSLSVAAIQSQIIIETTRSLDTNPITIDAAAGPTLLSIEVPDDFAGQELAIKISSVEGALNWRSGALQLNSRYRLETVFDGLPAGRYSLEFISAAESTRILDFLIDIR